MNAETKCPSLEVLRQALNFELPEERQTELLGHVEQCKDCQRVFEQMDEEDTSLAALASHLQAPRVTADTLLKVAMNKIGSIGCASRTGQTGGNYPSSMSLDFLSSSDDAKYVGRLGRYEIVGLVGQGGMGIVLKGFDPQLQRIVAIKVLAPELATNANARNRFRREGQAAAAVSHDHVVTIHSVDEADGLPHLVMEYISGQSLQDRIKGGGALELKEVLRIGMQTASGLAAAHAQGLVHRDIKPANILLENGVERVKITDFGLARAVDDVRITKPGVVTGTPEYMSPEQARGELVDHRSDLFSLGGVLYALCTGRPPFRAETTVAMIRRVCDDDPRPIQQVNPDIPDWLARFVEQLLAKDPAERFQSAGQVAELLEQYLAHVQHPSANLAPSMVKRRGSSSSRKVRHQPIGWLTAGALLLTVLCGLGLTEAGGVTKIASTIIRVVRGDGTLVIQVDDPNVEVAIDGDELVISGAGPKEIRLQAGTHRVVARKDGEMLHSELITITRGGKQVVAVTKEKDEPAASPTRILQLGLIRDVTGGPAPNGQFLTLVDWSTGDLAIRESANGQIRRLTQKGSWAEDSSNALWSVVSADSQRVAYSWFTTKGFYHELRTIGVDGSEPQILYSKPEVTMMRPHQWSSDQRYILVLYREEPDDRNRIALISVEDGTLRVLKDVGKRYPIKMSMSSDGRYVAYDLRTDQASPNRDIYLIDTLEGREISLVEHPETDYGPVWTPDGQRLVFFSDRSGSVSLWILSVVDGRPLGEPTMIRQDMNRRVPMGFTDDGSLYCHFTTGHSDVYEATIDLRSATLVTPATKVTRRFEGFNASPSWSPDGNSLAFISCRGPLPAARPDSGVLVVRSLETGQEKVLAAQLSAMADTRGSEGTPPIRWSPDSQSIMLRAHGLNGETGLYKVDVDSGTVTPIAINSQSGRIEWADWSGDGNAVYFYIATPEQAIVRRQVEGGKEEVIWRPLSGNHLWMALDVSPDGKTLAFARQWPGERPWDTTIHLMPSTNGEPRELIRLKGFYKKAGIAWTPDGRSLLFSRPVSRAKQDGDPWDSMRQQSTQLWQIPVAGGEPQPLGLVMDELFHFSIHPDGKRIAYSAGNQTDEVSVLKNFLPR